MTINGMLTDQNDFRTFQGGTGQLRPTAIDTALGLAEGKVASWLNTALVPTSRTEDHPWPVDTGKMMLEKQRIISIQSVIALHNLQCDCTWQTIADCAVIHDVDQAIITVIDCQGLVGSCWPCACPRRVQITYTFGFTAAQAAATEKIGNALRAAIFMAAVGFLQSGIGLDASGNQAIGSWSSAGYSESRQFNERSGAEEIVNPLIQLAKESLRTEGLIIKRQPPNLRQQKGIRM